MKVALIDKDGNILQVSGNLDINTPNSPGFFTGSITYDAAANTIDMSYYDRPLVAGTDVLTGIFFVMMALFSFVAMLLHMLLSATIETLIARLFKIPRLGIIFGLT